MSFVPGQTVSGYVILGPLGSGAMGQVYRARDSRLGREVAIKVLADELVGDVQLLQRFEREARTLAKLSHSNIAGIHGVAQEGEVSFLALELVPGEDLAQRLARGPLRVDEALDVARQIADGLEAAHEAGVVHRDLKPGNVRITPEGVVKILDFGLAKSFRPSLESADRQIAPLTETGLVVGTPAYMSPEQARGRGVDRRADVWAFGCVLYECLTGVRAHAGASVAEILASILDGEWDREALPAATPTHVRELLARCLDKDPRQRLRDIGEARVRLEHPPPTPLMTVSLRGVHRKGVALAFAGIALGVLAGRFLPRGEVTTPGVHAVAVRIQPLTDQVGLEEMPSVSPDGGNLAFVSRVDGLRQIFVRPMEAGSPVPVTRGAREHLLPHWATNSALICYRLPEPGAEEGDLLQILVPSSTAPQRIARAEGEAAVRPDGARLATFAGDEEHVLLRILDRESGAELSSIPLAHGVCTCPRWSPDGRSLAYLRRLDIANSEIHVLDLEAGRDTEVFRARSTRGIDWLHDGSGFVYASSQDSALAYPATYTLRRIRIDGSQDEPIPLSDARFASYVEPEVTAEGAIVASRIQMESDIWRFPTDGTPEENTRKAQRITRQTSLVQVPTVGPGTREVAYLSDSGGHANIWVAPVDGMGQPRRITHETDPKVSIAIPVWSPRSERIVYYKQRTGEVAEQWLVDSDGTNPEYLCKTGGGAAWSGDGEWVYSMAYLAVAAPTVKVNVHTKEKVPVRDRSCMIVDSTGRTAYYCPDTTRQGEIWKTSPPESGEEELLIGGLLDRLPAWPHHYALSPDDQWLGTPLLDGGRTNLYRISTADGRLEPVTDFRDQETLITRQVSWAHDSRSIFAALMVRDADVVLLEGVVAEY